MFFSGMVNGVLARVNLAHRWSASMEAKWALARGIIALPKQYASTRQLNLPVRSIGRAPFGASPQREPGHRAQDRNTQVRYQNMPSIQIGTVNLKNAGSNEPREQSGRSSRHGWRKNRTAAQHKPKGHGCQETDRRACPQAFPRPRPKIGVVLKLEQYCDRDHQGNHYRDG